MSRIRNAWAASCMALVGALLALAPPASAQDKTVRAVMHAEEIGRASCRERVL